MEPSPAPIAKPVLLRPVTGPERAVTLDVLRGVAVLGILLVNIQYFAFPQAEAEEWRWEGRSAADAAACAGIEFLGVFKFISIFSLLFGMGLALQSDRAAALAKPFLGTYSRRLGVLAAIGLAHGVLLWYGDILLAYAVFGFLALLFRTARTWKLLTAAVILLLLPMGILSFIAGVAPKELTARRTVWQRIADDRRASLSAETAHTPQSAGEPPAAALGEQATPPLPASQPDAPEAATRAASATTTSTAPASRPIGSPQERDAPDDLLAFCKFMDDETRVYQAGTWGEMVWHRSASYLMMWQGFVLIFGWRSLALFFLGICFVRRGLFLDAPRHRTAYRWMIWLGLAIGVPLQTAALATRTLDTDNAWVVLAYIFALYLGSLGMCLAYAGGVALLCLRDRWIARLRPLAAVGRMALTNYLSHSIVCGLIFYSYGLGLFGKIGYPTAILVVLAIFGAQLVISPIWLRRFRFGPCEWLWRSLTYWRIQPLLRRPAPPLAHAVGVNGNPPPA